MFSFNDDHMDLTGRRIRDVLCGAAAVYRELAAATVEVDHGGATNTTTREGGPPKRKRLRTEKGNETTSNVTVVVGCRCAPPPLLEMMFAMVAPSESPFLCIDCGIDNTQWCEQLCAQRGTKVEKLPPRTVLRWFEDDGIFAPGARVVFAHRAIVRSNPKQRSILVVSRSRAEALRGITDAEIEALVRAYEVPWHVGYPALSMANRTTAADVLALIPRFRAVNDNSAAGRAFVSACFDYVRRAVGPRKRYVWLLRANVDSPLVKATVWKEMRALMSCPSARLEIFWHSPRSVVFFHRLGQENWSVGDERLVRWCEAIGETAVKALTPNQLCLVLQHLSSTAAVAGAISHQIIRENSDALLECARDWSSDQLIAFVNQVVQSCRRYCDETKEEEEEQQLGLFLSHLSIALASRPDAAKTMQAIVSAAAL